MGLITAVAGAVSGTLADSWKEYFVCDALDNDVLMRKGAHKVGKHSTNYKGYGKRHHEGLRVRRG